MSLNTTSYQNINAQCCCFSLRKVTRAITQFYDRHLEPADIRATQFTLLLELSSATGKTLTEMAEGLVMDRTTLTRNLKPLEKAGFITTVKLADRRSKGYTLTDRGRQAIEKGIPLWKKAQTSIVGQMTDDRYNRLLEELKALRSMAVIPKMPTKHINEVSNASASTSATGEV
jgi:DNA-binding MarR family transcriptional regulator